MSNTDFLFEVARVDFKKKIIEDVADDRMDAVPSFSDLYSKYTGTEPEKKTAADQTLRDLIKDQLCDCKEKKIQNVIKNVLNVISASVAVAQQGFCTPTIPFILLGDVLDCFTLDACDHVFHYIEERVSTWKSNVFYTAGKNYLLRMCNDLLRRLSQSKNTVFCGRIQLFLARLFPLSEKSALNLVSQFNVENITVFNKDSSNTTLKQAEADDGETEGEDKMETELDKTISTDDSGIVDYKLYQNIWSLQDIFRHPVQCYTKDVWEKFTENADCVFRVFSSYKLEDLCHGHKTQSSSSNRVYFSKFLTSEKLTNLQLNDGLFRRQILTQFLILFRYLTANVKFKGANLVVTDTMKTWISEAEPKIFSLLEETPPNGKHFTKYIKHLLEREEYWITWKNEGCPSFMKTAAKSPTEDNESPAAKRRKLDRDTSSIAEDYIAGKTLGMGSPELTRLWNLCPDNLAACQSSDREFIPSLQDYFTECLEQNDPKNAIEDEYKLVKKSNFQWKALRLLSHRSQLFFTSQPAPQQFKTVPDYLTTIIAKLAKDFPSPPEENGIKPSEDTEDLTRDEETKEAPTSNTNKETGEDGGSDDVLGEGEDADMEEEEDSTLLDDSQDENTEQQGNAAIDTLNSDDVTSFATKIGADWTKLAPCLNLKAEDIKEISEDSDDVILQARQSLVTWQDNAGKAATFTALAQALKSAGLEAVTKTE